MNCYFCNKQCNKFVTKQKLAVCVNCPAFERIDKNGDRYWQHEYIKINGANKYEILCKIFDLKTLSFLDFEMIDKMFKGLVIFAAEKYVDGFLAGCSMSDNKDIIDGDSLRG
ncbi:MAG: hypothetical protein HC877_18860 [Thioploca sp.]|nr:hypothetical protein [Thioploca sp.]